MAKQIEGHSSYSGTHSGDLYCALLLIICSGLATYEN